MPIYIVQGKLKGIREMALNVSLNHNHIIENKENLRVAAQKIIQKSGGSDETTHKIVEQIIFEKTPVKDAMTNAQLSVLKASTQISLNKTLCATLKYLKNNASKKTSREVIFGELWSIFEASNQESEKNPYNEELLNFQINHSAKNIFAS